MRRRRKRREWIPSWFRGINVVNTEPIDPARLPEPSNIPSPVRVLSDADLAEIVDTVRRSGGM